MKVDVPSFRARFLNLYHTRYPRPVKDYLVANIETMLPLMAKMPGLTNTVLCQGWVKDLTKSAIGYVDTPLLSTPPLSARLKDSSGIRFDLEPLKQLREADREKHLIIVQDPFTSFYEAEVVQDFLRLVTALGKKPLLLPFRPNGKAQHIKGFLKQFAATATSSSAYLAEVAELGIPMVGLDPALVLCYRDEYAEILGESRGNFDVLMVHEWLLPRLQDFEKRESHGEEPWFLFSHCTEKTKLPSSEKDWVTIFAHFGAVLTPVAVGCCGMAGTFGHEAVNLQMSKGIYDLSWKKHLDELPRNRCLVTGYSCRSQVKRFEGLKPKHPVQALLESI